MDEFNSDDDYIYYCDQEFLRRSGVSPHSHQKSPNAVLGCNLKNDRMISVCFQGKPFNITVIQVYAPTSNAEEAEVEQFYEDLQDLLELTCKTDVLFIIGDRNVKVGSHKISGVPGNFGIDHLVVSMCKVVFRVVEKSICYDLCILLAEFS